MERNFEPDRSSVYDDNFPKILHGLGISLAVTSYQSSSLVFLRSDGENLDTHFSYFKRPMGIAAGKNHLTLGGLCQVLEFARNEEILARLKTGYYENFANFTRKVAFQDEESGQDDFLAARKREYEDFKKADALFLPRAAHVTGMINIHDIGWGDEGLWVVNSTFSCLATLSVDYSFVPRWKPWFITELAPEDRCHLNGMAMRDGRPKYATSFSRSDSKDAWYDKINDEGVLIDVEKNTVLLEGLVNPHSPRYHQGKVYLCNSGVGEVLRFDPETGRTETVVTLRGYTRGLEFYGPLMFVGLSRVRSSPIKNPIPLVKMYEMTASGIWVINLEDDSIVSRIEFGGEVDQIYDISLLENCTWPAILDFENPRLRHLFQYPVLQP